jgi:hypothetical protein
MEEPAEENQGEKNHETLPQENGVPTEENNQTSKSSKELPTFENKEENAPDQNDPQNQAIRMNSLESEKSKETGKIYIFFLNLIQILKGEKAGSSKQN